MLLDLICLLFGGGLTATGLLTFWKINYWWDFYRPIVLFIGGYVFGVAMLFPIEWLAGRFVNHKKEYDHVSKWAKFWLMQGTSFITRHAHIIVKSTGLNKVPKKEKFVVYCNHRSKFDNFVITNKIGKLDVAFITKRSNSKVFIVKDIIPGLCYIPIDREDKLQSLEAFKRASTLLETGATSIGVFPEGTRQQEKVIGDFHEGTFNIAIHSKAPIVITTLTNTEKVRKHWPLGFTKVRFDVLAVIRYEEYEGMTAKAISDMAHEMMANHLQEI